MAEDSRKIKILVDGAKANASVKDMEARVKLLQNQWKKMERGTEEYSKKTAELKNAKKRLGEVRGELRNTEEATRDVTSSFVEMLPFGDKIKNISDGFGSWTGNIKTVTGGFHSLKAAIAATGIGLLLIAIGSLVALLSKTQKGLDFVNEVMGGLGAVMDVVIGRLIQIGEGLVQFFSGDFSKGIDTISGSFDNMGKSIKDAFNEGMDIARARKELERFEREASKTTATLKAQRDAQNAIADDATRSFKEREQASARVRQLNEEVAAVELKIAKDRKELIKRDIALKRASGQVTDELLEKEKQAAVAYIQAENEATVVALENEKQRRELKQDRLEKDLDILIDGFDNVKTINEKIIQNDQKTIDERASRLEKLNKLAQNSFGEQIKTIEQFTNKQVDANDLLATEDAKLLNNKIRNLELSEVIEGRLLEIIRERRTALSDLGELEQQLNQQREERQKELVQILGAQEVELQNIKIAAMKDGEAKRLAQLEMEHQASMAKLAEQRDEIINDALATKQQEDEAIRIYEEQKKILEEEKEEEEKALKEEERQIKLEEMIADLEEEDELRKAKLEQQFLNSMQTEAEYQQAQLDQEKAFLQKKLAVLKQAGEGETAQTVRIQNQITDIENQQSKDRMTIAEREEKFKKLVKEEGVNYLKSTADAVIELTGKESKARKTAATAMKAIQIGEVVVSGIKEVAGYWEAYSPIPVAGPIIAAALTAIAVARSAAAISKIKSQKFASGGYTGSGISVNSSGKMVDSTGQAVAGVVHQDEWVAPAWMTQSPQYADVIGYLEAARKTRGYAAGGLAQDVPSGQSATAVSSAARQQQSESPLSKDLQEMGRKLDEIAAILQSMRGDRIVVPVLEVEEKLNEANTLRAKATIS